jgi:hypothetical protein
MNILEDILGGVIGGLKSEAAETDLSKMGTAKATTVKAPSNRQKATKAIADEINAIKGKLHDTKDDQPVVTVVAAKAPAKKTPAKKTTTARTPRTPAASKVATSS